MIALLVSIVLGLVPLLGLTRIALRGSYSTVDGLFLSLMLLTLSGIMFLNAYWQARDQGLLTFIHKEAPPAQKTK